MATQNYFEGINHIVYIKTSSEEFRCEDCEADYVSVDLGEIVNHYIENHNYKLLHIGAETTYSLDGKTCQDTVAVVGR